MTVPPRADAAPPQGHVRVRLLSLAQAVVALWLLASPLVLGGSADLVSVKDLVVGAAVLAVSLAALAGRASGHLQARVCALGGVVLVVASVALEFGPGSEAVARQWSEVVAGVVLVCLAAARAR